MPRQAGTVENIKSPHGQRYRQDPEFKEKVLLRLKEKVSCEHCDKSVCRVNLKRHQKSKKCLQAQEKMNITLK